MEGVERVIRFNGDGYGDNAQPINFLESHDEERVVHDVLIRGIDEAGATRKSELAAMALFTAQGVPMLYHGQEFGAKAAKTVDVSKIPWDHLESDAGRALRARYASLAYLRHTQGAMRTNNLEVLYKSPDTHTIVFQRWDDQGSIVVVALNFSPAAQTINFRFPRAGTYHEWTHDYDQQVDTEPRNEEIPSSFGKIWVFMS